MCVASSPTPRAPTAASPTASSIPSATDPRKSAKSSWRTSPPASTAAVLVKGLAQGLHKQYKTLEGTLRLVQRRLAAVSIFAAAVVSVRPERFKGVDRDLAALGKHLESGRVLVQLRHLAGDQLVALDPPLGLRPRQWNAVEAGSE